MDDDACRQYLTFALAGERFAVQSLLVSEVLDMPTLTRVPLGPPCLRGIVNLRGNAATVVDLGQRLGLEATELGRDTCLIILERDADGERALVALAADAVHEVVEILQGEVESTPEMGLPVAPGFLTGLARRDGGFLMLLDLDRLLDLGELARRGS